MQKKIGAVLSIGGLALFVYTLTNYLNETQSFSALGADVVISQGDITPVIIAGAVLLLGIILVATSKKG